jgi:hypothetical protein
LSPIRRMLRIGRENAGPEFLPAAHFDLEAGEA